LAEYLDLADYLLIAEAVVGAPAEQIARWPGLVSPNPLSTLPRRASGASSYNPM